MKWLLVIIAMFVGIGCTAPDGPLCESDADCAAGELCLSSGGVFFGGSYCAPIGNADAGVTPTDDTGADDAGDPCAPESACDGVDNDGDSIVDEGCTCAFNGLTAGVCLDSTIACDGTCEQPEGYESDESSCDGIDNDCDGEIDEGQAFAASAVTAGNAHTCAVGDDGSAYCWGRNTDGQLGTGTFTNATQPVSALLGGPVSVLNAGENHTCAIGAENGALFCWGRNSSRQVDNVSDTSLAGPVRLEPRGGSPWTDVAAGGNFTCAISQEMVFCWGGNEFGQAGQPPGQPISAPTQIQMLEDIAFDRVTAGRQHACAWSAGTGTAYCWGDASDGRLFRPDSPVPNAPQAIVFGGPFVFENVSAGADHTCVSGTTNDPNIGIDGILIACAGFNGTRQLGTTAGPGGPDRDIPMQLVAGPVASGDGFTCAYQADVGVACWGENAEGQVTPPGSDTPSGPILVEAFAPEAGPQILDIATGGRHSCGVSETAVRCWGSNDFGQLGAALDANPDTIVDVACAL